ncbi:MAG: hypothetical protein H5T73_01130 [Actinobacteria bacterium]|nr:hypothetical protein [Actinomycetota bacterium]
MALVLLIPFLMEPYTMRPRKPGFLEKKLREEDQAFLLAVAVVLVLLIPFLMEPYTMRSRKPGFLEKKLREEDQAGQAPKVVSRRVPRGLFLPGAAVPDRGGSVN